MSLSVVRVRSITLNAYTADIPDAVSVTNIIGEIRPTCRDEVSTQGKRTMSTQELPFMMYVGIAWFSMAENWHSTIQDTRRLKPIHKP